MRKTSTSLILGLATALALAACGGGGGGGSANRAPVANAGSPQTVAMGATVFLNGSGSNDPDGTIASYQWTQTSGTAVTLANATTVQASFTAPNVTVSTALAFRLVVTDNDGQASTASIVTITVSPALVTLAGTVRYARVNRIITSTVRLDYTNPEWKPARGVVVRILNADTLATLATGVTSNTGTYSLTVPGNTSVTVQVEARLLRDSTQPLPRWNVRVQNGTGTLLTPYRHTGLAINSTSGNGDVDIPLGINASGTATGTRASGPFAILDTMYTVMQAAITAMPTANFPTLYVDWGTQNSGAFGGTYFTLGSGAHIALMSDLTEDTDEFDQPVIAHEFGHYLQHMFARSDSLGGNHGLGDRLDMRVAFNEGFATGFAAIALNDPLYYDTYVLTNGTLWGFGYDVEINPSIIPPDNGLGLGCWCNEATVWSLVWDLFDSNVDSQDGVALGFAPVWQALLDTDVAPNASAFVSIFSFIRAVKDNNPSQVGAINALVAAQNIDASTIEPFATTETHDPLPNVLPVYKDIVKGTPVMVHSIDDGGPNSMDGDHNKLGAHAFLRYVAQTGGNITITVITSNLTANADPDFQVYSSGTQLLPPSPSPNSGQGPPNAQRNEVATLSTVAGTTYIIDAYDCANGCTTAQGTPGDYILSVTIQ